MGLQHALAMLGGHGNEFNVSLMIIHSVSSFNERAGCDACCCYCGHV